jgi:hypothetical protein
MPRVAYEMQNARPPITRPRAFIQLRQGDEPFPESPDGESFLQQAPLTSAAKFGATPNSTRLAPQPTPADADLQRVIDAGERLPYAIQKAIMSLVDLQPKFANSGTRTRVAGVERSSDCPRKTACLRIRSARSGVVDRGFQQIDVNARLNPPELQRVIDSWHDFAQAGLGDVPGVFPLVILGRRKTLRMRPKLNATTSDRDTPDAFLGSPPGACCSRHDTGTFFWDLRGCSSIG